MKWLSAIVVSSALGLVFSTGCTTSSYCFDDCEGEGTGSGGTTGDGGGFDGPVIESGTGGNDGSVINLDSGSDGCQITNNGVEICDGLDNDCNGQTDEGIDFTKVQTCGTCDNNCATIPHVVNPSCDPPATLDGKTPGTCKREKCEQDWYDIKKDDPTKPETLGCEYQCTWNPNGTNTVDTGGADGCGKDDDCDGQVDEDMNTCTDTENCGKCGNKCVIANGTAKCVTTATGGAQCTTNNTTCEVDKCNPGFYDADNSPGNGCEYECTPTGNEVCDGVDNDCDGKIDNADDSLELQDPDVGKPCFGGTQGICAAAVNQGLNKCLGGVITCCDPDSNNLSGTNPNFPVKGLRNGLCDAPTGPQVIKPNEKQEICNNLDDDCDGTPDDSPVDEGGTCGSSVGNCQTGTEQCQSGVLVCQGKTDPTTDICNGQDDDCDGVIDGTIGPGTPVSCTSDAQCTGGKLCLVRSSAADKVCASPPGDAVGDCKVPPPPPPGVPQPCQKGALACVGGVKLCQGAIEAQSATDKCGEDTNCDGTLSGQPDLQNDVKNCGTCGNDCTQISPTGHGTWACQSGTCVRTGCEANYINCDGNNNDCERFCSFVSSNEQCNGIDDNCNCQVDESVSPTPSPVQVCGVAAAATDNGCLARTPGNPIGVDVTCNNGGWQCSFTTNYCTGTPPDCASTTDTCDNRDNNCNGATDENFKPPLLNQGYLGQACASDDGLPPPGHGQCRTTGQFVCSGASATACNAVKNNGAAGPELCDNADNDCDGSVDEPFKVTTSYPGGKGTNTANFVRPAVTQLSSNLWVSQYEISRTGATNINPGSGNGYQVSAPAGTPQDKTQGCSVAGVIPWFNLTPVEAAQTCEARGGRLCNRGDWQTACRTTTNSCRWGYNPRTGGGTPACQLPGTYSTGSGRRCNIGPFDFDGNPANGITNGLLPTASGSLQNCWADWAGTTGNGAANNNIRDVTGNLWEIVRESGSGCSSPTNTCVYKLMGGGFNTAAEAGAECNFTFFSVDKDFKLFDAGFRCCFDQNPTL